MTRRALYPLAVWIVCVLALPVALIGLGAALVAATNVETLLFDHPHLWWLTGLIPLAGLIRIVSVLRRRRAIDRFASRPLAALLAQRVSPLRQAIRAGLVVLAVLFVVAAIIGPRWGYYVEKQKVYGVDIVVALDVSRSMLAPDVSPNRLERAKQRIREQLTERAVFQQAHRLGLIAFAGSTSLHLPLTTDHLTFRAKLDALDVSSAPRGGTAIGQAIRRATDLFARSPEEATRIILLFTDGEDHEGGPVEAARAAWKEQGIHVYTIGVGDPASTVGAQIPSVERASGKPLLHDGQIVFSKLNVATLQQVAEAGDGRYMALPQLPRLVDAIAGMRQTRLSSEELMRHKPRYQWFVAVALFLLGVETIVSDAGRASPTATRRLWETEEPT